jgi:hypothetical protein
MGLMVMVKRFKAQFNDSLFFYIAVIAFFGIVHYL